MFADDLSFATGVQPWKGGVFVTMAGKVAYMKDTNGDDKADVNETWYTGFTQGNQQLRANHPDARRSTITFTSPTACAAATIVDAAHPEDEAGFDQRHGFSFRSAHAQVRSASPATASSA